MTYQEFFQIATRTEDFDGALPYPYQERLAEAEQLPHLLGAPTGAGKTAASILGWLWRRMSNKPDTPRRLVYCLPMRVLVEQTQREASRWIKNLGLSEQVDIHMLMGGVETDAWYLHPEKQAILIGTQDMLLSRALNRGYAASRFHWPIDFALLNNDCLWVFDEPQLMGSGLSTSAQLAGLRHALSTIASCPSLWMSATLEPDWLETIDFRGRFPAAPLLLSADDYNPARPLYKRMKAAKMIRALGVASTKDMKDVAKAILEKHEQGTQTLIVVNTVDRAKALYAELERRIKGTSPNILLIHSRFRPRERQRLNDLLQQKGENTKDRILVATQVVEAGVDISSRTLIIELAPWPNIVQRIGRCNRTGDEGTDQSPAKVFWIDLDEKLSLPYAQNDLKFARDQLKKLEGEDVSPKALEEFKKRESITLPFEHKHVLRRRDLLDLFDTTPDLSGNDIDIQRFVRGDDRETDVQVFWRAIPDSGPSKDEPSPSRDELCSAPVGQVREFLQGLAKNKRGEGYTWNHLDGEWKKLDPKEVRPGLAILLPSTAGGYSTLGWESTSTDPVTPVPPAVPLREEAAGDDQLSAMPEPQVVPVALTISQHTQHVCDEMAALLDAVGNVSADWRSHLLDAARWHDAGKAHEAFQIGLRGANPNLDTNRLWAKSGVKTRLRHGRPYFRHELVSALAALHHEIPFAAAYLLAAHHGRVRLGIRALPDEETPDDPSTLFALGVRQGDPLPEVDLSGGVTCSRTVLDLSPMLLGVESSWTARALDLLADLGPFKLAYFETLLRAADARASRKEASA